MVFGGSGTRHGNGTEYTGFRSGCEYVSNASSGAPASVMNLGLGHARDLDTQETWTRKNGRFEAVIIMKLALALTVPLASILVCGSPGASAKAEPIGTNQQLITRITNDIWPAVSAFNRQPTQASSGAK